MLRTLPTNLVSALSEGNWHDPGRDTLRGLLGPKRQLPDMELFADLAVMERVATRLDSAGYVDDPAFCMVRHLTAGSETDDARLSFHDALFIGGSIVPGDDVFVALDLRASPVEPTVRVLDWTQPIPERWVVVGRLGWFLRHLAQAGAT